jgi:hypothetical protein
LSRLKPSESTAAFSTVDSKTVLQNSEARPGTDYARGKARANFEKPDELIPATLRGKGKPGPDISVMGPCAWVSPFRFHLEERSVKITCWRPIESRSVSIRRLTAHLQRLEKFGSRLLRFRALIVRASLRVNVSDGTPQRGLSLAGRRARTTYGPRLLRP